MATSKAPNYFWDSCCFIAYLNDERHAYNIDDLEQYLDEAREGKSTIYTSTLVLAEVRPSFMKSHRAGSFSEFMDDFGGSIVLLDATPNIMQWAGYIRDLPYSKANSNKRQLSTPDAIMLATCVHLEDDLGVKVDGFHTYDKGKRRGIDGKGIPLLTYEEWCVGFSENDFAARAIRLNRGEPKHPEPRLAMKNT